MLVFGGRVGQGGGGDASMHLTEWKDTLNGFSIV